MRHRRVPRMAAAIGVLLAFPARGQETTSRVALQTGPDPLEIFWSPAGADQSAVVWKGERPRRLDGHPAGFEYVCRAPCELQLRAGPHRLGLAPEDEESPNVVRQIELPAGNSTVEATYHSRSAFRLAGLAVVVIGVIAGALLAGSSEQSCVEVLAPNGVDRYPNCKSSHPDLATGLIVGGASALVGTAAILFIRDSAQLTVRPR